MTQATHHLIWFTKSHKEDDAVKEIRALGIEVQFPVVLELQSRGTQRRPKPIDAPCLRSTLFIRCTDEQFNALMKARNLTGSFLFVCKAEWDRYVQPYIDRAAQAYSDAMTRYLAGDMAQYVTGQELLATLGPFAGKVVEYIETVERAHDQYPKIRASVDLMGRKVTTEFDPLHVRAAG